MSTHYTVQFKNQPQGAKVFGVCANSEADAIAQAGRDLGCIIDRTDPWDQSHLLEAILHIAPIDEIELQAQAPALSTTFQNEAEQNWPEDEARNAADYALSLFADEGRDYYHQWLIKERSVFIHNLFDGDAALITRYINRFNLLTAPTTNLYL